jgi:hypothetical protein
MTTDAVLLMAYGSPDRLDRSPLLHRHPPGGPPAGLLDELSRYRAIGGGRPCRHRRAQRGRPRTELAARNWPAVCGCATEPSITRSWTMAADGVPGSSRSPYCRRPRAGYRRRGRSLADSAVGPKCVVDSWHDSRASSSARATTAGHSPGSRPDRPVLFTHSLPGCSPERATLPHQLARRGPRGRAAGPGLCLRLQA